MRALELLCSILWILSESLGFRAIKRGRWRSLVSHSSGTSEETILTCASGMLRQSAVEIIAAGDDLMDAATYLGEYGLLAYDPASLSSAGCAITNAGRNILDSVQFISDGNWEEASLCLGSAADSLDVASGAEILAEISMSAKHLTAACSIQGCIVIACSAVPDLILCADGLVLMGKALLVTGESMREGGKVEDMAGAKLVSCTQHLILSGNYFKEFARLMDNGILV
jgi:hypothetical protein